MATLNTVWSDGTARNTSVILGARDSDNRTNWIVHRLREAIGDAKNRISVQDIVMSTVVAKRLEEFYSATGPLKIIFFYQRNQGYGQGTSGSSGSAVDPEEGRQDSLILIDHHYPKLRGKCIYFIRRNMNGVERDTQCPDLDMTCGEVFSDTLQGFHHTLHNVYLPLLEGKTQDWGRNTEASTKEYLAHARRFDEMIADAVSSLQGGIELKRPEKKFIVENKQQAYARAAGDPELLAAYESVMEDWCVHCERLLLESELGEDDESGPDTEFEFWRNRMAKFNSVAEQLKQRDCKCVIGVVGHSKSKVFKRWKTVDSAITDSLNEAKDNVKYLSSLEKYTEPLYSGKPEDVIDALPNLMNNTKSMLTIARFYGTSTRMTTLFMKITNQMITNCKKCLTCPDKPGVIESLWDQDVSSLLVRLRTILKLHETYVALYTATKDKLALQPKGKQFDFNEALIFGKFDLFVKRVGKLLDMFTTIHQFSSLALHNVEGMDALIQRFLDIMVDFRQKPYDLLDYSKNAFDRDYVEHNDNIADLEQQVQTFIDNSFENIVSTEQALTLLHQFEDILVRDSLKSDLDSKYTVIFHNYGLDLEAVLKLYEKHKGNPPLMRNAPPVTGNILWAKQLLNRIEEPMRKFRAHTTIMQNSKEAKKIIKMYNKVARALVEFETLWHSAWKKSIDAARSGLQATLIIRHPTTNRLFVNFDREILQLIRETKFLQRFKVEVPDSARMVLMQEDKFKSYFNQLSFALKEYDRVTDLVPPIVKSLLQPHLNDLEAKLQPGMVLLSWQSMNIDSYLQRIHGGLSRFEELVRKISDILENRIEGNLKAISKTLLVELPTDQSFTLEQFVMLQEKTTKVKTMMLDRKNEEVERAVWEVVNLIQLFPLEVSETVSRDDIHALWKHYSRLMYLSILRCTKQSFFSLKKRLASRSSGGFLYIERPFFDVDIELSLPVVTMNPSLDEIQGAINRCALNVLRCSKNIFQWSLTNTNNPSNRTHRQSYHHLIGQDYQIVAVCLMLTGAVEGTKKHVHEYLKTFMKYDHLWKEDKQASYDAFLQTNPGIEDFDQELQKFMDTERMINEIPPVHNIGCLSLETGPLKHSLRSEALLWKKQYTSNMHLEARRSLMALVEYLEETDARLDREYKDLDDARLMMAVLKEVRDKETDMDMQISPIEKQYALLVKFDAQIEKEELDRVHNLPKAWKQVVRKAREASDNLNRRQDSFRTELLTNVSQFILEVRLFRQDFVENGPMEEGITPLQAADRMRKYKKLYMEKERKWRVYSEGEALFGMPPTNYMELEVSRRELELLDRLYSLYMDVLSTMKEYKAIPWTETGNKVDAMKAQMEKFQDLCKKMPRQLREWDAFVELKTTITDFSEVLPLLQMLVGSAMRPRHWTLVQVLTGISLDLHSESLVLGDVLKMDLHRRRAEVEEICHGAVNEQELEQKLETVREDWAETRFEFQNFKNKGPVLLKGKELGEILEKLEESMHLLGGMVSSRHAAPFKDQMHGWITKLSAVSEVIEQWTYVQSMWVYMEAVFSAGDIAKQIPQEAKRFAGIDKSYMRLTTRAFEVPNVLLCCYGNDQMKTVLPHLASQLELSQRSLTGYFETKRAQFPRFYFVSDGLLLQVLSQGADPTKIVGHLQHVFGSLSSVRFDGEDAQMLITSMVSGDGEEVALMKPLKVRGGVEEYLTELVGNMQATIKESSRDCVFQCQTIENVAALVKDFPSQVSVMGLHTMTTAQIEEGIRGTKQEKGAMVAVAKRFAQVTKDLLAAVEGATKPTERRIYEVMVTGHMYHKEVVDELVKKKVRLVTDFDWVKVHRHYWSADNDEYVISISDASFSYKNEFQGCREKLVVTPLTERCFNAVAQAIATSYCSAVLGPPGTGKTETVKDLGRMLGKYFVLFNCSAQMELTGLGRVLKGLTMAGCWGYLEGIQQLQAEVLSVAAHQIGTVMLAQRERKKQFIFTDGQNISLQPGFASFITMNNAHLEVRQLPENLKSHLRGIVLLSPQVASIIRVRLAATGFADDPHLARKMEAFFGFCTNQLSRSQPYMFGMRTVDAVLRAGRTQRQRSPGKTDLSHIVSAIRLVNLPRLDTADAPIFLALLADMFGSEVATERVDVDQELQAAMAAAASNLNLEFESVATVKWREKALQCYELVTHHHGLAVVGPVAAGKTMLLQTVHRTCAAVKGIKHSISKVNPSSMLNHQIYGNMDPTTSDWTEGVLSSLWRKAANASSIFWILFDGPVDHVWIENLNSVLDDNKLLTLANGDRLPLSNGMKVVFETDHLDNATPATISRLVVTYVGANVLGWEALVASWLNLRKLKDTEYIRKILDNVLGAVMNVAARLLKAVGNVQPVSMLKHFLDLLQLPVMQAEIGRNRMPNDVIERHVVFALYWAFGGALELDGKARLESELKKLLPAAFPSPELGKLVDCYLTSDDEWDAWRNVIPSWTLPLPRPPTVSLFVPTTHNVTYKHLMDMLVPLGFPVLLTGAAGVGKTSIAQDFLGSQPSEEVRRYRLQQHPSPVLTAEDWQVAVRELFLCSTTTPETLQRGIESALEKKQGKTFGGTNGRFISLLIDDLSLPEYNKWGQQPTTELVRQLVSDKGFYNLDKAGEWKTIKDCRCVATMMSPGPGRNDIPSRLKRHWLMFTVPMPNKAALESTFMAIVKGYFSDQVVTSDIATSAAKTVDATIQIWYRLQQIMSPAFHTFYYGYTMRDLARVFQGLTRLSPDRIENRDHLLRLWIHECDHAFLDKLASKAEAVHAQPIIGQALEETFGQKVANKMAQQQIFFAPFSQTDDELEDDDDLEDADFPHSLYQVSVQIKKVTDRIEELRLQPELAKHAAGVILFPYAVENILKIARIITLPRGSCVLLGPQGTGKQSLSLLASALVGHEVVRVPGSKSYELEDLMIELKKVSKTAGVHGKQITLYMCNEEHKDDAVYDHLNQLLLTGEVQFLFTKDEMDAMLTDATFRQTAIAQLKGAPPTTDNLRALFFNRIRNLVHLVLTLSEAGTAFASQNRRFPAISSCCCIIAFQAWPDEALYKVAELRLKEVKPGIKDKETIIQHMLTQHHVIATLEMGQDLGQIVPVTPKNYVVYLEHFVETYTEHYERTKQRNDKLNLVLLKLADAVQDMEDMQVEITESEEVLHAAHGESATMLKEISALASACERKRRDVQNVEAEIASMERVLKAEQEELARLMEPITPIMDEADVILDNISARDLQGVKAVRNPPAVIRVVFDAVLLLKQRPMNKIQVTEEKGVAMYKDSFQLGHQLLLEPTFIESLHQFPRDAVNEETIELLQPYFDHPLFSLDVARKASGLCAGLCSWIKAVQEYHEAIREHRGRMESVHNKKVELARAEKRKEAAQKELLGVQGDIDAMQKQHEDAFREKQRLQEETESTKTRLSAATALIAALANERRDWELESQQYQHKLSVVAGSACLSASFLAYCGPLSYATRSTILSTHVRDDLKRRDIAVAGGDVTELVTKPSEKGDWRIQGLPNDALSMQNGVLVTRALLCPLLIDPQGQGGRWVRNKEAGAGSREGAGGEAQLRVAHSSDKQFRNILEDCMAYGWTLLVENMDEDIEALIDPVLRMPRRKDKESRRMSQHLMSSPGLRGRGTTLEMHDGKLVQCSERFTLYVSMPQLNPAMKSQIYSKFTVVAFNMTPAGLEDQLLSQVLEHERPDLQAQRKRVLEEGQMLHKSLLKYEDELVSRLYTTSGNLMEDGAVVEALATTKQARTLTEEKVKACGESQERVESNCEEYRAVARRGSLLFFLSADVRQLSPMYQTSLASFLRLYGAAMAKAPEDAVPSFRVDKIVEELTLLVFRHVQRGLFSHHADILALLLALRVQLAEEHITEEQLSCFLKGSFSINPETVRRKPYNWIPEESWLNCVQLFHSMSTFRDLPDSIQHFGEQWRYWHASEAPEGHKIPDIPSASERMDRFAHLLLVRALRMDRIHIVAKDYVAGVLGDKYVELQPLHLDSAVADSSEKVPVVCILAPGTDPTEAILAHAKKLKREVLVVSLGQEQETVARRHLDTGISIGCWVLLQNAHLSLRFISDLEQNMAKMEAIEPDFRLWITSQPHPDFPIGILQMSLKLTTEAPIGVKTRMRRAYAGVTQDVLDEVGRTEWRPLLFSLHLMHSIILERRKFGSLGWSLAYEFGQVELQGAMRCLRHAMADLESKKLKEVSWAALRYMIGEVLYGSLLSAEADRRLLTTLTDKHFSPALLETTFTFLSQHPIPVGQDLAVYRASIESLPDIESPDLLGLTVFDDHARNLEMARSLLRGMQACIEEPAGPGGERTKESVQAQQVGELLAMLPPPFSQSDGKEGFAKEGGTAPMNVALRTELECLNRANHAARASLHSMQLALSGAAAMTSTVKAELADVRAARVPGAWLAVSWEVEGLAQWVESMQQRHEQWRRWLDRGRPICFWLGGFMRPRALVAAIMQDAVRRHKTWGLEDMALVTEVTKVDAAELKGPAENGVYVSGLQLEGCTWNRSTGALAESSLKKSQQLTSPALPVVFVCPVARAMKKYEHGVYECPLFASRSRAEDSFICHIDLKTDDSAGKWVLRGAAAFSTPSVRTRLTEPEPLAPPRADSLKSLA